MIELHVMNVQVPVKYIAFQVFSKSQVLSYAVGLLNCSYFLCFFFQNKSYIVLPQSEFKLL